MKLFWRKYEWEVGQEWNFLVKVTWFFFPLAFFTEWRSFGHGLKDLVLPNKLIVKVDQCRWKRWRHKWCKGIDSTWVRVSYFGTQWVKYATQNWGCFLTILICVRAVILCFISSSNTIKSQSCHAVACELLQSHEIYTEGASIYRPLSTFDASSYSEAIV